MPPNKTQTFYYPTRSPRGKITRDQGGHRQRSLITRILPAASYRFSGWHW